MHVQKLLKKLEKEKAETKKKKEELAKSTHTPHGRLPDVLGLIVGALGRQEVPRVSGDGSG